MRNVEAIHCAARRYCADQIARWTDAYAQLEASGSARVGQGVDWTYSEASRRTYPRYNVLKAILDEVERFVPEDFPSGDEARALLCAAAEVARSPMTESEDAIESAAMREERERFIAYIAALSGEELPGVQPLPYRTVLGRDETDRRFNELLDRWGKWYGGGADRDRATLPPHLILQASRAEDCGVLGVLHDVLRRHDVDRVFAFPESDPCYEEDLTSATLYRGSEIYWTDDRAQWLIQSSHEDSLTVGGDWLVRGLQEAVPGWKDLACRGWDGTSPPEI